jgi:hypothetical protein
MMRFRFEPNSPECGAEDRLIITRRHLPFISGLEDFECGVLESYWLGTFVPKIWSITFER